MAYTIPATTKPAVTAAPVKPVITNTQQAALYQPGMDGKSAQQTYWVAGQKMPMANGGTYTVTAADAQQHNYILQKYPQSNNAGQITQITAPTGYQMPTTAAPFQQPVATQTQQLQYWQPGQDGKSAQQTYWAAGMQMPMAKGGTYTLTQQDADTHNNSLLKLPQSTNSGQIIQFTAPTQPWAPGPVPPIPLTPASLATTARAMK